MARAEFFFFTAILASWWPSLKVQIYLNRWTKLINFILPRMVFKCYGMVKKGERERERLI